VAETETIQPSIAPPPWFPAAMRATERLFTMFGPPLSERLTRMAERLGQMNGGGAIERALFAASATPFLALIEALRADYGLAAEDPRVVAIGEATLALYFYVRVQDDIVDEPDLLDRGFVYVAEIFNGASQRAFAQAVGGGPAFFAFRDETMATFASAAVWELDAFRTGAVTEDDLVRMGQKFLPMAVPLGALALVAGRPADMERLVQFVTTLGTGLQMLNDVLNVKEDHVQQRLTPVLRWLYASGKATPGEPPTTVRIALLSDEALTRALNQAKESIGQAEQLALALGAERVAAIVRQRAAYIESVPHRLLSLYFNRGEL
jgi:hypothetical protein